MFNKKLKKQIEEQNKEILKLKQGKEKLENFKVENENLRSVNNILVKRTNKAEAKIRGQTEAELYFQCAKIMKKLEKDEKKESLQKDIEIRGGLMRQLEMQSQQPPAQPFGFPFDFLTSALSSRPFFGKKI